MTESEHFLSRIGPLDQHELLLLIYDLDCYEGLLRRSRAELGPPPPPLEEYLKPGRDGWGWIAELLRDGEADEG